MNLIQTPKMIESTGNFYYLKDYRKVDLNKINDILVNMYDNIKSLDETFDYRIEWGKNHSVYLGDAASYHKQLKIFQIYENNETVINVLIPKLMYDNFFIINGSTYIPLIFLEKAPLDRIFNLDDNKNKIFININPVYNFTFNFEKMTVQFRSRIIQMDVFFRVLFSKEPEYLQLLHENELIDGVEHTEDEYKKFIKNFLDFYKWEKITEMELDEWMDKYLLLDYYKETFKDFYGLENFNQIIKKVVDLYITEEVIDMANIKNRRLVLMEYLMQPLFEAYVRILYGIVDKKSQKFLPTINQMSILSTGFNTNLHGGQLYDISLPYSLPLINKISQDIKIIKEKLPKSWTRNDESSYKKICPISVSPANMALTVLATTELKVNYYGRILDDEEITYDV